MKRLRITAPWMTLVLALALVSCSRKQNAPEGPGSASEGLSGRSAMNVPGFHGSRGLHVANRPGNIFHVQYSENTSIVDLPTVARALQGVSADHSIFLFDDSPALRQKLVPGKCVLFEGLDLRKVDALAVDGSTLIVGTEKAPLREALKNAKVQFEVPVDFQDISSQLRAERMEMESAPTSMALLHSLASAWDAFDPPVYADSGGNLQGDAEFSDDQDGKWKLHFQNVFNADHSATMTFHLEREAEGLNAEIDTTANLSKFIQKSSMLMADGQFQAASFQTSGLHGKANLDWTITTSEAKTPMGQGRVKLPGAIKIPLEYEIGMPMSLEMSELLLFHPAFTNKNAVAKGGFSVSYSGDEGFKLSGSDMETPGSTTGDGAITTNEGFSPLSAYGVVVAMALPRVELKIGAEELFDKAELPISSDTFKKALDKLQNLPLVGKMFGPKGKNPLETEASAFFQLIISTTASHSGMLSLVPCQQFTMLAKGQVGVDAKWLGTPADIQPKDLFTKSVTETKPNNKICGGAATGQPQ